MKYLYTYDEVNPDMVALFGGKAEHVAIMHQNGFAVPAGTILSTSAFAETLASLGVDRQIELFRDPFVAEADLKEASRIVRSAFASTDSSAGISAALHSAYDALIEEAPAGLIVRSSATVEDMPNASLAGLLSSFPGIRNYDDFISAVRRCWASIFTYEAHIYLREQSLLDVDIGVAILVQVMVPAERSGVIFSVEPVTGDTDQVVIDTIFGFGEKIVSGEITPERSIYSRTEKRVVRRKSGHEQAEFITPAGERKPVFDGHRPHLKLSDREARELAETAIKIETLFGRPQDIEWAFSNGRFYILQSRAIVAGARFEKLFPEIAEQTVLLRGTGASRAVGSGRVRLNCPECIPEVDHDTVIATKRLTNDLAVHLRNAAAVVTDDGGATSHGANILREFGVPCVLGTTNATDRLKEGQIVTVDGLRGVVYEGDLAVKISTIADVPETLTRIYVSILVPERARQVAPFAAGVSSLRDDYFMLELGAHPIRMIREGLGPHLEERICSGIGQTLKMFAGKPVWYKTMDAPTDEFSRLKGGEDPDERNPLLGWRGIGRELQEPEMLKLEFRAARRALEKTGGDLGIKLPFIRVVEELRETKRVLREVGLRPHQDVKIGISVENPAVAFTLADFINEGIDFLSVGVSDLVMCTLALDRESEKVAPLFRPNHPAVLQLLDDLATTARRYGVFICAAGESARDPAVLPHLVRLGYNAIGVALPFFADVKREVARIESELPSLRLPPQ